MKVSKLWERALSTLSEEEQDELLLSVSKISVCALPSEFYITESGHSNGLDRFFSVEVSRRSKGRYAVTDGAGLAFDSSFAEEYEGLPSSRSDEFKERFRHGFLDALILAEEVSLKHIKFGPSGMSVEDIIREGRLPGR